MKALVCDAHSIASLECVRSLGRRGVTVIAAGEPNSFPLASFSRHCAGYCTYASPLDGIDGFIGSLAALVEEEKPEAVILSTDRTMLPVSLKRERFGNEVSALLPADAAVRTACDKVATLEMASRLGVPAPRTAIIGGSGDLDRAESAMSPPFVAKPRASHSMEGGRVTSRRGVVFLGGGEELRSFYSRQGAVGKYPILQEWRPGICVGVSGVFDRGRPLALFSHRRIREEHPLGGRSSYCEGVEPDGRLCGYATSLLSELKWHGPAMVEFRVGEDGAVGLMEINGRLWGSLPLAVASGVDVPWLLYCMSSGVEGVRAAPYAAGRRGRYLLAEINRLIAVVRGRPAGWRGRFPTRVSAAAEFAGAFFREATYFALRRSDPAPGLRELGRFFGGLPARALHRKGKR